MSRFTEDGASSEPLDVWMHTRLAEEMGVSAGETFDIAINVSQPRQPILIRGLWQATDPTDDYWFNDPDTNLNDALIIRRQEYIDRIQPVIAAKSGFVSWHVILDDSRLNPAYARAYAEGFERGMEVINKYLPDTRLDLSALDPLKDFVLRQTTLTTVLLGFNVPALGILLAFLVLISAIVAEWQQRETSILVSRGMGIGGALGLVMVEMLLLFVVGIPLGIWAGMWVRAADGLHRQLSGLHRADRATRFAARAGRSPDCASIGHCPAGPHYPCALFRAKRRGRTITRKRADGAPRILAAHLLRLSHGHPHVVRL